MKQSKNLKSSGAPGGGHRAFHGGAQRTHSAASAAEAMVQMMKGAGGPEPGAMSTDGRGPMSPGGQSMKKAALI
jgi:hypothetical protein